MQCSNEARLHITKAKRTDERRTKPSDSINSKSNSWILFERDLFHFDAPAFVHNKRDIALKQHILSASCAAASAIVSDVVVVIVIAVHHCYIAVNAVA